MDVQQPAAISVGQAIATLWPYLTGAGAVVAFLVGWVRRLAVSQVAYNDTVKLSAVRLDRLEQADIDQDTAAKEQKAKVHERIDHIEAQLTAHAGLEEHPVGKVRREHIEAQLAALTTAVEEIRDGVTRLLARAGA